MRIMRLSNGELGISHRIACLALSPKSLPDFQPWVSDARLAAQCHDLPQKERARFHSMSRGNLGVSRQGHYQRLKLDKSINKIRFLKDRLYHRLFSVLSVEMLESLTLSF